MFSRINANRTNLHSPVKHHNKITLKINKMVIPGHGLSSLSGSHWVQWVRQSSPPHKCYVYFWYTHLWTQKYIPFIPFFPVGFLVNNNRCVFVSACVELLKKNVFLLLCFHIISPCVFSQTIFFPHSEFKIFTWILILATREDCELPPS